MKQRMMSSPEDEPRRYSPTASPKGQATYSITLWQLLNRSFWPPGCVVFNRHGSAPIVRYVVFSHARLVSARVANNLHSMVCLDNVRLEAHDRADARDCAGDRQSTIMNRKSNLELRYKPRAGPLYRQSVKVQRIGWNRRKWRACGLFSQETCGPV